jgi:cytochrome c oxidase cbb3-type subunit 3
LDNVLPPWWVNLFYITIIFSFIYLVRFHVLNDYTQAEEFETEMEIARAEIEKYKLTAPDLMDKDKVTLLTDVGALAEGKAIYEAKCVACHKSDGGGSIGPNLTDEYWILGGGIKNVFNTIMEGGREGKGMISWKSEIKPSDIQKLSSYVLSLQGSNPKEAKAAEGDLWIEATPSTTTTATDSTAVVGEIK